MNTKNINDCLAKLLYCKNDEIPKNIHNFFTSEETIRKTIFGDLDEIYKQIHDPEKNEFYFALNCKVIVENFEKCYAESTDIEKKILKKGPKNQIVLQINNKFLIWDESNIVSIMPAYSAKLIAVFDLKTPDHYESSPLVKYDEEVIDKIVKIIHKFNVQINHKNKNMIHFMNEIGKTTCCKFDFCSGGPCLYYLTYILTQGTNIDYPFYLINHKKIIEKNGEKELVWRTHRELDIWMAENENYSYYSNMIKAFHIAFEQNEPECTHTSSNGISIDYKRVDNFRNYPFIITGNFKIEWLPSTHYLFSYEFHKNVLLFLLINKRNIGTNKYVPKFISYEIIKFF